jgi:hypothetical protein
MNSYKTILEVIELGDKDNKDVYTELLKTEENVLKTINNVIQYEQQIKLKDVFLNKSIYDIIHDFSNTWFSIYKDIFIIKDYKSLSHIFLSNERKVYVGIMIILMAVIIFIVFVS